MGTALFKGFASDFNAKDVDTGITIDSYLPTSGGSAFEDVDTVPSDGFFEQVNFKGAFGTENWLDGWSLINDHGGFVSSTMSCPAPDAT